MMASRMASTAWLVLALSGAAFAEEEIWSPYDRFNAPNEDCELVALVPAPKGAWGVVGHTCNRLNGEPVGSLVVIDALGKRDTSPVSVALEAASDRDRMKELVQLLPVPSGGYIATYSSRDANAPQGESGPASVAHVLIRHTAKGTRAEAFNQKVQQTLRQKVGASSFIITAEVDAKSRLIVAASTPDENYLKEAPLWLLRFNPDGTLDRAQRFDPVLKELRLGWYVLNQVRARADGGLFLSGRFQAEERRADIPVLALNAQWKSDSRFNTPLISWLMKGEAGLELSLIAPGADGSVVGVGELGQGDTRAHVVRLTRDGRLDPAFHPFRQEGPYPQGRFMRVSQMGVGPDGAVVLAQNDIPAVDPPEGPWRAPGLVRLKADGTVDARFQAGLGAGLRYRKLAEAAKKDPDSSGFLWLVAAMPDGSVVVDGFFDELAGEKVTPPLRLAADGTRVRNFQARFETVLPPKKQVPNATTSAFFKADGRSHFIACSGKGNRTETFIYWMQGDTWGHTPSCAIHLGGDAASPGGAWQHCDARIRKAQAQGATCEETKVDPLDVRGHR
ncbi:delta-60 repeat domain-containing protein [Corallococcus macrosporus]|uniref:Delta-60 repeat domain-containing protein n=1 Tax=Corallococcus macrosporus TaxID=35 RepID=A0ABS3DPH4_9BACT|nr:delta-60 repeat domain-containing protein [Corallococcus macrosporus]MBN8233234.1 delta-60 repeat domain-containing protein [Corallococcus macrosporus]